ncbi:MAG: hypothetical protein C4527_07515 [Candidatus Omnitrophota bacterium]|jgi:hypothetical protein|nr:MAG: hypothetical protein C4527_07515 [Candidatus Omnitrophota bacterium]
MAEKKSIIVKDDGHIDPEVWFGRYGLKYKSLKIDESRKNQADHEVTPGNGKKKQLLKIRTTEEGLRRWRVGIEQSKKQKTSGWYTLELRLYVMKHGTANGFQVKNFSNYQEIVEFYA